MQRFCQWLLYKRWGWRKEVTVAHPEKYIICLAPHTSNWDFVLGQLYMRAEGLKIGFLMKKEWFRGPLGTYFRRIGGIPVWRSKNSSMTDNLAETARQEPTFRLCITPSTTRRSSSPVPEVSSPRATSTTKCGPSSNIIRIAKENTRKNSPSETTVHEQPETLCIGSRLPAAFSMRHETCGCRPTTSDHPICSHHYRHRQPHRC